MSQYGKLLAQHLATELGKSVKDVTAALDNFTFAEKPETGSKTASNKQPEIAKKAIPEPKAAKDTKVAKTAPAKGKDVEEAHTCVRIKKGQTEKCGKPAKRSIESNGKLHYYCGAEKSGCYATELNAHAKKELDNEAGKKAPSKAAGGKAPKVKTGNGADRKAAADVKSESLLKKIIPKKKFVSKSIETKSHGKVYYDIDTRYLFDKLTYEVYGVLGKDNDTIEKLSDDNVRQLEASGHTIRSRSATDSKAKEPKAKPDTEEAETGDAEIADNDADETIEAEEEDKLSSDEEMSSDDESEKECVITSDNSEE